MLKSIGQSLAKARSAFFGAVSGALGGKRQLTPEEMANLENLLLSADVGTAAAARLLAAVSQGPSELDALGRLKAEMLAILREAKAETSNFDFLISNMATKPQVWLIYGVNGSGKTTSLGKLGHRLTGQGLKVMMAAADTYRAAAGQQLAVWAGRAGAELVTSKAGADPAAVAYDAVAAAQARGADVLLVDTAGRMHNKRHLQDELRKIHATIGKRMAGAPHLGLLVMDASAGQTGLTQARLFSEAAPVDGIILTKLDGTAKGGMALAVRQEFGIPVLWVGTGEGVEDLQEFSADDFVESLLGQPSGQETKHS
jgi:fused signal recognition particle receptor